MLTIVHFDIGVEDVERAKNFYEELFEWKKAIEGKIPVPSWGYMAICLDTEGNRFGLWQEDKK